jgi:hypothetical protein
LGQTSRQEESAQAAQGATQPTSPSADAHRDQIPHAQSEGLPKAAAAGAQVESAREADYPDSGTGGPGAEGLAEIPCDGSEGIRGTGAHREALSPFVIEVRGADGDLLAFSSLYDFLERTYVREWTPDLYRFDELDITVNGARLLPQAQGRA